MKINHYAFSLGYALSTATSILLIHLITKEAEPVLLLTLSALLAIFWFNMINRRKIRSIYQLAKQHFSAVLLVNTIVATQWFCTFYAAKYATPFNFLLLLFLLPVLIANCTLFKTAKRHQLYFLVNSVTIAAILLHMDNSIGILCSLTSGILSYIYRKYTYKLMHKNTFTSTSILAIRNYGFAWRQPASRLSNQDVKLNTFNTMASHL